MTGTYFLINLRTWELVTKNPMFLTEMQAAEMNSDPAYTTKHFEWQRVGEA